MRQKTFKASLPLKVFGKQSAWKQFFPVITGKILTQFNDLAITGELLDA